MADYSEKRRYPRLDVSIRVDVDYHDPKMGETAKIKGTSKDLAVGGIAFYNESAIDAGNYVVIYCHLPEAEKPAAFFGRVVRCQKGADGKHLVSIKFLRYEKKDLEQLEKHLMKSK
jgi:hypothetical protein